MTLHTVQQDRALSALASLADSGALSRLSITLTTAGGIVTGKLISGAEWAKLNLEIVRNFASDEASVAKYFEIYQEKLTQAADEKKAAQDAFNGAEIADDYHEAIATVAAPTFIHLDDARVLGPSGIIPTGKAVPWRGRLSEVAGWAIGEIK